MICIMKNRTPEKNQKAFTLIEVLIATAIFSALIGSLYSVFHGALRLRESTFKSVESVLPRSYIIMILKRDIINMAPPSGIMAGSVIGEMEESGEFRMDSVEFYSTSGRVLEDNPWGDLQKIEYFLAEPEDSDLKDSYDFIRSVSRNLLASTEEDPDEQILLSCVAGLEITYYDGEYWQDSWDSTTRENEAPSALWIKIQFSEQDGIPDIKDDIEMVVPVITEPFSTETGNNEN
jgi:general secretion pathway protein J